MPLAPAVLRPATTLKPIDRRARALSIARRAAPFAACALGGLLLGLVLRSGAKPAHVADARTARRRSSAAPAPVALPALDPPAAAPVLAAPAADAPAPRAPGECVARVTTKPAGATVAWGEIALGTSPIAHAPFPAARPP